MYFLLFDMFGHLTRFMPLSGTSSELWEVTTHSTNFPWDVILGNGVRAHNPVRCMQNRALEKVGELLELSQIDPRTPLWGNAKFQHMAHITPPTCWLSKGIESIADVWENDAPIPFENLKSEFDLPNGQWLTYQQVQSALIRQSRSKRIHLSVSLLMVSLQKPNQKGTLSGIYKKIHIALNKNTPIQNKEL
ncbi:hypothetical protein XELAEV_18031749mg [Xenopus laevis]|uniref:Uncharacterized protein n=1 Tax=Xenopus laevis TaxID=8355 RepID=A0A974HGB9_XENLA|nr:hypothetical protein XELAEV_18031749mg [Xenopus laevis]